MKPKIIEGNSFFDSRGELRFVNSFLFDDVRRFYIIKHPDTSVVRAWQGHQIEKKYFYPIRGSIVVAWVKIDNFDSPSNDLTAEYKILSDKKSEILCIPRGYANGIKVLEADSEIMVLSNMTLEESMNEKIRYSSDLWLDWSKF